MPVVFVVFLEPFVVDISVGRVFEIKAVFVPVRMMIATAEIPPPPKWCERCVDRRRLLLYCFGAVGWK